MTGLSCYKTGNETIAARGIKNKGDIFIESYELFSTKSLNSTGIFK